MRQRNKSKRNVIAGVLALGLVLQGTVNMAAFAADEETAAQPAAEEQAEQTAPAETAPAQEPEETAAGEVEEQLAQTQDDASLTDTLTLTDAAQIPSRIEAGTKVGVSGTVTSAESAITSVSVLVYDQAFQPVTGGAAKPGTQTYDLSRLDTYTAFDQLAEGTYYFRVIVSNGSLTDQIVQEAKFVVGSGEAEETEQTAEADALTLTDGTQIPDTIAQGTDLKVQGTVTSAASPITLLTCAVYNSDGTYTSGKTIIPQTKSYDLERLSSYVLFSALPAGNYTYAVIATNAAHQDQTLVRRSFTVEGSGTAAAADTLTLTDAPDIPASLGSGDSLNVTGIVTSADSELTMLAVGVYNADKEFVTGKTIAPNAKSYDISGLDEEVAFDSLEDGSYMFAVIASNATYTNQALLTCRFTVGDAQAAAEETAAEDTSEVKAEDTLHISDAAEIPETLVQGEKLAVTGIVSSDESDLTAVTVGIYDTASQFMTGRTVDPKSASFDLSELDADVAFDSLPEGTYVYAVIASNAANSNTALYTRKFTVGSGTQAADSTESDSISVSGSTSVPAVLETGSVLHVAGVVTSASSELTAVTVGVYDAGGNFVTGKSVNPKAGSYDLSKLDRFVEFDRLPSGTYHYAVIASNAAAENVTLVNKTFRIGGGESQPAAGAADALTLTGAAEIPSVVTGGSALSIAGV